MITVFSARESRTVQPGFYFAFGETQGEQFDPYDTVRFYWNVTRYWRCGTGPGDHPPPESFPHAVSLQDMQPANLVQPTGRARYSMSASAIIVLQRRRSSMFIVVCCLIWKQTRPYSPDLWPQAWRLLKSQVLARASACSAAAWSPKASGTRICMARRTWLRD